MDFRGKIMNEKYWRERPDEEIMDMAHEIIDDLKSGYRKPDRQIIADATEELAMKLASKGFLGISEETLNTALEIASKEQDYEPGYIKNRNYPTKYD